MTPFAQQLDGCKEVPHRKAFRQEGKHIFSTTCYSEQAEHPEVLTQATKEVRRRTGAILKSILGSTLPANERTSENRSKTLETRRRFGNSVPKGV